MSIGRFSFLAPAVGLLLLASTALPALAQQAPEAPKKHGGAKAGEKAAGKMHRLVGSIQEVSEGKLVITDRHKKEVTFVLESATTLEKVSAPKAQPQTITAKELTVGDAVVVHYAESDGKKTAQSVRVRPPGSHGARPHGTGKEGKSQ